MKVYILLEGVDYAGSSIKSIHFTNKGAEIALAEIVGQDSGWIQDGELWENGASYLVIEEEEIRE